MKKSILLGIIIILLLGGILIFLKVKNSKSSTDESTKITTQNQVTTKISEKVTEEKLQPDRFILDKDEDGVLDTEEEKLGLSDQSIDTDADGLTDYKEINTFKTDPKKKDTDDDGFADGYEVMKGYNPLGSGKLSDKK